MHWKQKISVEQWSDTIELWFWRQCVDSKAKQGKNTYELSKQWKSIKSDKKVIQA